MACKRSAVRSRYSPPKSTVLRRKYGAFLFAEAGFWGLHCFSCTGFRLFAGGSYTTPNFRLYTVFKKDCLPPGFSAGCCIIPFNVRRKVEVEGNVELIPTINIYPADKLIDDHFLCFKTGAVVKIRKRNQFFVQF
jgi:hypothetical protein